MKYLLSIIMLFLNTTIFAQIKDLGNMPETKRDKALVKYSKKIVKQFGPAFYNDCQYWTITEKIFRDTSLKKNGLHYYVIAFFENKEKRQKGWDYCSRVFIWKDSGIAFYYGSTEQTGIGLEGEHYKNAIKQNIKFTKDNEILYTDSIGKRKKYKLK